MTTVTGITVERSLAEACKVPLPETFFEFDSAKLEPQAPYALDSIAKCLSTGPLQGQDVLLVGRADPRGSTEYNVKLGMSRAESVAQYLESHGVNANQITLDSEGKTAALPIHQAYPFERRVDIRRAWPTPTSQAPQTPQMRQTSSSLSSSAGTAP
jgi:peptidoglycan-associated lipoprotein